MNKKLICEQRDGFWYTSIFHYQGASLIKEAVFIDDDDDLHKTLKLIKESKVTKVVVNLWSDKINSLEFLYNISHIKYLTVLSKENIDNQPVYGLKKLKFLNIVNHNELDLNRLPKLQFLATNRPEKIINLDQHKNLVSLKMIDTNNKIKSKNLDFLENLKSLKVLYLDGFDNTSIDCIQSLDKLKVLYLCNMKKLNNISAISKLRLSLTRLSIVRCNNILNLSSIGDLDLLEYLSINEIREVESLSFIKPISSLVTFIFTDGTVLDNDMSYLIGIPDVFVYPMKKSYFIDKNDGFKKPKFISGDYKSRISGNESIELWLRIDN